MTIKQQGGIFGRNPTFNTITSDGNASIGGDIVLQGGNKVYFDGGVDNYMDMFSADKIRIAVGGAASFKLENPPHNAFILNSSGNIKLLSGSGIDFSATAGTGTSELFDDYEEGTWTPTFTGSTSGSLSFGTVNLATYTKIGRIVYLDCYLSSGDVLNNTVSGSIEIGGLPFTAVPYSAQVTVVLCNLFNFDETDVTILGYTNGTKLRFVKGSSNSVIADADLNTTGSTGTIMIQATYEAL